MKYTLPWIDRAVEFLENLRYLELNKILLEVQSSDLDSDVCMNFLFYVKKNIHVEFSIIHHQACPFGVLLEPSIAAPHFQNVSRASPLPRTSPRSHCNRMKPSSKTSRSSAAHLESSHESGKTSVMGL